MSEPIDRPGPHLVQAPEPWLGERELPFEPEPTPGAEPCRSCGRIDRALEAELIAAYQTIHQLEELLMWVGEEHHLGSAYREDAEREVQALQVLLAEFEGLASKQELALAAGRRAVLAARRRRQEAERVAHEERARASRLARELKRWKDQRGRERRPSAEDPAALAFAAAEAAETDGRVLSLESALGQERERVARYARYVEALEARLKRLAEEGLVPLTGLPASPREPALLKPRA